MDECVFCDIVEKEKHWIIYQDEKTVVFLDHRPIVEGHILVIPKEHSKCMEDISEENLMAVMRTVRKIGPLVMKAVSSEGYTVSVNNHDQQIFHSHWHIIPRSKDDELENWPRHTFSDEKMNAFAEKLRELL